MDKYQSVAVVGLIFGVGSFCMGYAIGYFTGY